MTAVPAVETKDLVKVFERGRRTIWQRIRREPDKRDRFRAVDGIDLVVEPGEIFGLLGPTGAGKTTTMKMLATLLIPTSGTIRVLGIDPLERPREVRARLGAMLSGERSLYWKLTGRENLEYFAALYHVPPGETKARIEKVLAAVKLADRADDYVERYSTGMRQRLALARALLPDPPLVVLDEPTVGLDPQASRDLRDRVRELKAQGRTVLLTTHYMEEADQLCDRVAIIDHGRIVALDTPAARCGNEPARRRPPRFLRGGPQRGATAASLPDPLPRPAVLADAAARLLGPDGPGVLGERPAGPRCVRRARW